MVDYNKIAKEAEADLNSYGAKTGNRGINTADEGGVNAAFAEKKFESAHVEQGDELSTNAGYNKRIPPSEGGDLDDRGRQATGQQYEGVGGPLDKIEHNGENDNDVVPAPVRKLGGEGGLGSVDDIATKGQDAVTGNVGRSAPGVGGQKYPGENTVKPDAVPGSLSAEGYEKPSSAIEVSEEAKHPEQFGPQ